MTHIETLKIIVEAAAGGAGGHWIFSAAASTMPALPVDANYFLKWLYAFVHFVGANLDKVHIPGSAADLAAQPKANGGAPPPPAAPKATPSP